MSGIIVAVVFINDLSHIFVVCFIIKYKNVANFLLRLLFALYSISIIDVLCVN